MNHMEYLPLAVYGVCAAAQLVFCAADWRWGKIITKVLLMPALLCYYVIAAWSVYPLAVAAILLGWTGDVLLLWPEKKGCFLGGLGAFLAGHVCYMGVMGCWLRNLLDIIWIVAASGVILAGGGVIAYRSLSRHAAGMRPAVIAYLTVILAMTWIAFLSMATNFGPSGKMLLIGALCFVASDYILAREIFVRKHRWGDFVVMATYMAAQLSLVCGLILI